MRNLLVSNWLFARRLELQLGSMIQPSTLLSLFLAGMGAAFTLTGSISAVKIRRTRSTTSLGLSQNETDLVREGSMQFAEQTSIDTLHGRMVSRRGVGAIFSGDENSQPPLGVLAPSTEPSERRVFSKRILSTIIGIAALALYGVAVWQYALHERMQSWVQANFGVAAYLLNYDVLLVVSVVVGLQIFWSQFRIRSRNRSP
jgi:hypothetical protein